VGAVSLVSGLASWLFCKSVEVRENVTFFLGFFREPGADIGFGEIEVHFRVVAGWRIRVCERLSRSVRDRRKRVPRGSAPQPSPLQFVRSVAREGAPLPVGGVSRPRTPIANKATRSEARFSILRESASPLRRSGKAREERFRTRNEERYPGIFFEKQLKSGKRQVVLAVLQERG
jgi:hypothetical protein